MHNAVSEQLAPKHDTRDVMPGGSLGSILIIDDEAAIRESLETLLELEGYRIATAETGEDGLARIAERPYDLIRLDFALPDRNGLEILNDIRDRDPNLAVIMITAYGTVENAVRAMQGGAVNFVQKPWDNEKLLADIRAAVARRRAEEENIQLKRATAPECRKLVTYGTEPSKEPFLAGRH